MVYIFLQGRSIERLKDYVHLIDPVGNQFATVNQFDAYDDVMKTIGTTFDYIHSSCDLRHEEDAKLLSDYLKHSKKTLLITSQDQFRLAEHHLVDVMYQVCIEALSTGNSKYHGFPRYNSLTALLLILLKYGHRNFALFGCDGHGDYCDTIRDKKMTAGQLQKELKIDTCVMNSRFWDEVAFLGVHADTVNIVNVNPDSFIECFKRVSYEDFFNQQNKGENNGRDNTL